MARPVQMHWRQFHAPGDNLSPVPSTICRRRLLRQCGQRLKVSTFIYRHLQGNPGQQQFTIRSGILTGSDTSDVMAALLKV